ncbi:hypothetical protein, partial [Vogesella indigofera]|uniref:hypothetical protein n=1 Tax=Vogesella indigofera TaxID=45465 RepID=UPI0035B4231C
KKRRPDAARNPGQARPRQGAAELAALGHAAAFTLGVHGLSGALLTGWARRRRCGQRWPQGFDVD